MKNKILIFGLVALLCFSCQDFLEKNPPDQLSSETFWNTENDATMALAGVYSNLKLDFANRGRLFGLHRCFTDALAGEAFSHEVDWQTIATGYGESTSGAIVDGMYRLCYTMISGSNIFLQNIEKVEMDEGLKNQYIGEVLFLRAFAYFYLTEYYGGVILYTEPPTLENAKIAKSSKDQVVDQVLKDLDKASSYLPDVAYTDGHVVRGTAYALKAKVLLHNGRWAEAASMANQCIQSEKFSLSNDYMGMFLTRGQEDNKEIMFSTRYSLPDDYAYLGPNIELGWYCSLVPTKELIDAYECIDGLPIDESPLYDPDNVKMNRDPRMGYTLIKATDPWVRSDGYEWYTHEIKRAINGFLIRKHVDGEAIPIGYDAKDGQDWVLLRYAEVLLIYAEAKNEESGPDNSVYHAVNAVRARAGMPDLPTGLSKDEMRERIRNERRVEFALEGLRDMDVRRWRISEKIIPQITDPNGIKRLFDPQKNYLLPFPQSEIDINPKLEQNPGY